MRILLINGSYKLYLIAGKIGVEDNEHIMILSEAGLNFIQQFEGFERKLSNGSAAAYLCPSNVPSIGWGTTRYPNGVTVRLGDVRTRTQCDEYKHHDLRKFSGSVNHLVKVPLTQSMFDALVSFTYNTGVYAFETSTLLRLLNAGDYAGAAGQFERWNKGEAGRVLPGLVRRRDAEEKLFRSEGLNPTNSSANTPPIIATITARRGTLLKKRPVQSSELDKNEKIDVAAGRSYGIVWRSKEADGHVKVSLAYGAGNWYIFAPHWDGIVESEPPHDNSGSNLGSSDGKVLNVPYYSQRDNVTQGSDNWTRTCFSSSCAMLAKFLKPGSITGDDDYISKRRKFGDTTDANAQVACLRSLGINSRFVTTWNNAELRKSIDRGIPVPVGILHQGPSSAPRGGGHWIIVIGYQNDSTAPGGGYFIVHDPWGEINNSTGQYISTNGNKLKYSYSLFDSRWTVVNDSDGWAIAVN
jgi:GH24 family phage-related lysozyme (muramidase)